MAAPIGANVGIYYDGWVDDLAVGDYLRTPSGRTYLITMLRRQTRGAHVGRYHLRCDVVPSEQPDADDRVFPIFWYSRG